MKELNFLIPKTNRNYLMGIAITLVVFEHLSMFTPSDFFLYPILHYFFQNGSIGVNIFIFLSAYGLCFSFDNNSHWEYYSRRFKRIYPIYPIWIIVAYLYYDIDFAPMLFFIYQITGMGLFIPQNPNNWYMEYITLIYLFFPFIFCLLARLSKHIVLCSFAIIFASLFSCIFVQNYDLCHAVSRIPMLISGILAYICEKNGKSNSVLISFSFLAILSVCNFARESFLFIPLLTIAFSHATNPPFFTFISFIGKHSLEIFLTHMFAIRLLVSSSNSLLLNVVFFCISIVAFPTIANYIQRFPYKKMGSFK